MSVPSYPSIVFISGAFVTSAYWEAWVTYFESRGHPCYAPDWPHKQAPAAARRAQHPHSPVATTGLADVLAAHAAFIRQLPAKPILIGHSYGGLLVQLLLQQDLAVAGVAIESVPPFGVWAWNWSLLRAALPMLGLLTTLRTSYLLPFAQWQSAIAHGRPLAEQRASYAQFIVPESKRTIRQALTRLARLDFTRPHAPLLLLAGGADRLIPAALTYANYRRYPQGGGVHHALP